MTFDMYLPAVPALGIEMKTDPQIVQLTLSMMLIGGAVGQLVIGPLTDRFGRRRPVLLGVAGSALLSFACAAAPNVEVLIGLRLVQGFVNSAASIGALAIIRDKFVGSDAARLMSRLMLVIGLAPILAPSIGSYILRHGDWRLIFIILGLMAISLGAVLWHWLPETLPTSQRQSDAGVRTVRRNYLMLLKDRHFVSLALTPGLSMAVLMSYVVGSPFVLKEGYGMSNEQFALLFAANGLGLVISAQVNAALVRKVSPARLLRVAIAAQCVCILGLVGVAASGLGGMWGVIICLWVILCFQGLIPSNASALALSRHDRRTAGSAAAIIGAGQAALSGLISPLVGLLGGDALAMALVMAAASIAAAAVLAFATPMYRRGGWMKMSVISD